LILRDITIKPYNILRLPNMQKKLPSAKDVKFLSWKSFGKPYDHVDTIF